MKKEIQKLKSILKGRFVELRFYRNKAGFVILFAVTLASILLAISLGVGNIALREIKFGTDARDTNDAFFAADTGIEFVLFNDKPPSIYPAPGSMDVTIIGLGSTGKGCAKVNITKTNFVVDSVTYIATTVVSKGYNIGDASCVSSNPDRIERELTTNY